MLLSELKKGDVARFTDGCFMSKIFGEGVYDMFRLIYNGIGSSDHNPSYSVYKFTVESALVSFPLGEAWVSVCNYSMGMGLTETPTFTELLSSMALDISFAENEPVEFMNAIWNSIPNRDKTMVNLAEKIEDYNNMVVAMETIRDLTCDQLLYMISDIVEQDDNEEVIEGLEDMEKLLQQFCNDDHDFYQFMASPDYRSFDHISETLSEKIENHYKTVKY